MKDISGSENDSRIGCQTRAGATSGVDATLHQSKGLGLKWTESGYSRKNQCANAIIVSITYVDAPCCVYCDSLREINRPNVVSPLSPPYSTAPLPARVLMMSVLFVTIQIRLL
jgi:hypothetical protein